MQALIGLIVLILVTTFGWALILYGLRVFV